MRPSLGKLRTLVHEIEGRYGYLLHLEGYLGNNEYRRPYVIIM